MIKKVNFPLFEIAANPVININNIKQRRFSLIDREESVEMIIARIVATENVEGIRYFLTNYIRTHKDFTKLRLALESYNPAYIDLFEKLVILK
jgi:hypothetical protein